MSDFRLNELTVGIIGTGRVGRALAVALNQTLGTKIAAWNRTAETFRSLQMLLPQIDPMPSPEGVVSQAELVFLTVSDDALANVVDRIKQVGTDWTSRTVAHFSGRSSAELLRPLQERGACVIAFHPAMAFAGDVVEDAKRLTRARLAVSALTTEAEQRGKAFAGLLGCSPFSVRNEDRILYHAALTHASNHLVTLVVQACELLDSLNIDGRADLLRPLLESALCNALEKGTAGATGPVVRGDAETLSAHLAVWADDAPDLLPSYAAMTIAGIGQAERSGRITPAQAQRLRVALERQGS